jgi:hypothetical protein
MMSASALAALRGFAQSGHHVHHLCADLMGPGKYWNKRLLGGRPSERQDRWPFGQHSIQPLIIVGKEQQVEPKGR